MKGEARRTSLKPFLIIDIETDSLNPSKIWVAVTKDFQTKEEKIWIRPDEHDTKSFLLFLSNYSLVGHNLIGFDLPALRSLCSWNDNVRSCVDTLVLSRLRNSWEVKDHSLAAWGERLGFPKIKFEDFSSFSQDMVDYCVQDVRITDKLFEYLKPWWSEKSQWPAIRLEHDSAILCKEMEDNGFYFEYDKATELLKGLEERLGQLSEEMRRELPPRVRPGSLVIPRVVKSGEISKVNFKWLDARPEDCGYQPDAPFTRIFIEEFKPGQTKRRLELLWKYGWQPIDKTDGYKEAERTGDKSKLEHYKIYGWKVNETNLATLPEDAPESARKLVQWILMDSRRSTLVEWLSAYNDATGRIHGTYNHIGSWTHRKSHSNPNKANVSSPFVKTKEELSAVEKIKDEYDGQFRGLWSVPKGKCLVGVDAEGIQLRVLAHYLDNKEYTEAIVNGRKEDESDVHNVNKRALGAICRTRDDAKTFIYAWLLGAGIEKIRGILGCSREDAASSVENFYRSIPGLRELKYGKTRTDSERGYFVGLDGRVVFCNQQRLILAGYLQNGESVIMKHACRLWHNRLTKEKVPFLLVNDVHDEWQTEVPDDRALAEYVGQVQIDSIRQAGIDLKVKCRLDGNMKIGYNWLHTH